MCFLTDSSLYGGMLVLKSMRNVSTRLRKSAK